MMAAGQRAGLLMSALLLCLFNTNHGLAEPDSLNTGILYLKEQRERPPTLSNRETPPEDQGLVGAQLGIEDNNTTGKFLGHHYRLETAVIENSAQGVVAVNEWLENGSGLIVADVGSKTIETLLAQTPVATRGILMNAANPDNRWRTADCAPRLLHTNPSRAMLADALGQFLSRKRWREWLVIRSSRQRDQALVQSLRRSAQRFGGEIIDEREWTFATDLRRDARDELPLFTQARGYDVVVVADELGDVGEFIPYNTWLPRPVVGTQGLTPTAWSPVLEQWGALQLQQRFMRLAGRPMTANDFGAWLAVRSLGEGITRVNSNEPAALYQYLLSKDFAVGAFVGRSLTFRDWNGQLRQPIALVSAKALIDQSPQPGFLHPVTELDTLGFDAPEVSCPFSGATS